MFTLIIMYIKQFFGNNYVYNVPLLKKEISELRFLNLATFLSTIN
jgi:hypothetical protein